jgi:hypothetical protein
MLDHSSSFTSAVSGFNEGDSLDLGDVAFGSNITVAVDTNGTAGGAEGANWVDVCVLDNYGTSGADPLTVLIDNTDHQLMV